MINVKNTNIRIIIIITILSLVYLSRYLFIIKYDYTFFEILTEPFYNHLRAIDTLRNNLQIFNFLTLDILIIITFYLWIVYDKSWRFIFSLILFLLSKFLISHLVEFKQNDDMIWYYPGITFLSTTYYQSNNNFPSGTPGLFIISILEILKFKNNFFTKFLFTFAVFNNILLISLRASSFISIIISTLLGLYCFKISEKYSKILNTVYDFDKAIRYSNIRYTNINLQSSTNTIEMTADSKPQEFIKTYENVNIPCGVKLSDFLYSYSAVSINGQR